MTYCDNLNMLSIGLGNGMIVSYTLEIESYVYSGNSPEAVHSANRPQNQAAAPQLL